MGRRPHDRLTGAIALHGRTGTNPSIVPITISSFDNFICPVVQRPSYPHGRRVLRSGAARGDRSFKLSPRKSSLLNEKLKAQVVEGEWEP